MTTRILLAEDNEQLARMLTTFLDGLGYGVVSATTGPAALKAIAAGNIDLVLLDLKLPEISGIEVLHKLRKSTRWADLPVIVMTGIYRGEQYVQAARKLGVVHYLEKPFTRDAFLSAVRSTVDEMARKARSSSFLDLLLDIYGNKKSGMLALSHDTRVAFMYGEPFSFQTGDQDEFATFLIAQGKITSEDRQQFLTVGSDRFLYAQAGLLPFEELAEECRIFLSRKLTDALEQNAAATFTEGPCTPPPPFVAISLPKVIYQALRNSADRFNLRDFTARHGGLYPARTRLYYRRINLFPMDRDDIGLMALIDAGRKVNDILAATDQKQDVATLLQFLLVLGMIVMHGSPIADETPDFPQKTLFNRPLEEDGSAEDSAVTFDDLVEEVSGSFDLAAGNDGMATPLSSEEIDFEQDVQRDFASLKDKNYYEVFGLTPGSFSIVALKEIYFAKTRQYSPERFMELSGSTQVMASDILAQYANAYNTLSSIVAKERYDEMLNADTIVGLDGKQDSTLQASIQFQSGQVFLDMGEFDNAEKALQDAYILEPQDAGHCAFLAWCIYRNPANKNSRNAQEKARLLLSKSLQIDKSADAFAFRGWMLLDEGRDGLAEGEFLKALKLNPKDSHARDGIRMISEKREGEKKGLFRRMFS